MDGVALVGDVELVDEVGWIVSSSSWLVWQGFMVFSLSCVVLLADSRFDLDSLLTTLLAWAKKFLAILFCVVVSSVVWERSVANGRKRATSDVS